MKLHSMEFNTRGEVTDWYNDGKGKYKIVSITYEPAYKSLRASYIVFYFDQAKRPISSAM